MLLVYVEFLLDLLYQSGMCRHRFYGQRIKHLSQLYVGKESPGLAEALWRVKPSKSIQNVDLL